jgi:hypothetical protein
MLFDTKALRQLRLCDLEFISGSLSDRIMYLEFSPPVTQLSLLSEYDLLRESQVALIELKLEDKESSYSVTELLSGVSSPPQLTLALQPILKRPRLELTLLR